MRIVVIYDLHLGHDYPPAYLRSKAFQSLVETVSKIDKDYLIVLGDVFHSKWLTGDLVDLALQGLKAMKGSARGFILVGNHDLEAKDRYSIKFLREDFKVVASPEYQKDIDALLIPYFTNNPPPLKEILSSVKLKSVSFIFMHYAVLETLPKHLTNTEHFTASEILKFTDYCFAGHFHSSVMYVERIFGGVTIPVSFADHLVSGIYSVIDVDDTVNIKTYHHHGPLFCDLRKVNGIPELCNECQLLLRAEESDERLALFRSRAVKVEVFPSVAVPQDIKKAVDRKFSTTDNTDVLSAFISFLNSCSLPAELRQKLETLGKEYLVRAMKEVGE